jgi:membrane AbrB-like protein
MLQKYFIAFLCGVAGGAIFSFADMPIPWTLGPLAAVIFAKVVFKKELFWHSQLRNIGFVVLGYVMGSPFTPEAGQNILSQLPLIFFITLVTIALSLFFAFLLNRYTKFTLATVVLGSIPGGLAQVNAISEDIKDSDTSVVTLLQTIRVLVVVFFVPFIALHGLADEFLHISKTAQTFSVGHIPLLFLFFGASLASLFILQYRGVSPRYIIAPMLVTAALVLSGIHAPPLPLPLIALAQIFIGLSLGVSIKVDKLKNWKTISFFGVLSVLGVIISSLFVSFLLSKTTSISLLTAFISIAPGGIAEMGVTAIAVNADLSMVIAFQLFRLLFILLILIPLTKYWLNARHKSENFWF